MRSSRAAGAGLATVVLCSWLTTMSVGEVEPPRAAGRANLGVMVFANDASRDFGDVGGTLARQILEELSDKPKKPGQLLSDTLSRAQTTGHSKDLEQERALAVAAGRTAGAAIVIYGRVHSVEVAAPERTSYSGSASVRHHYEAPNVATAPEILNCYYTVSHRRDKVLMQVTFGFADCQNGHALLTEQMKREFVETVDWVDFSGDLEAIPSDLRGAPRTEPRIVLKEQARRACREISREIAYRAKELAASR